MQPKTTTLGVVAVALLLAPVALAHETLPANVLANGGFETGFTSWAKTCWADPPCAGLSINGSAACLGNRALEVRNQYTAQFVKQTFPTHHGYTLLDFHAKVLANAANTGPQAIAILANYNPIGSGNVIVRINIASNAMTLRVFDGSPVRVDVRDLTVCHHYQLLLNEAAGTAVMLVDGSGAASASGLGLVKGAETFIVGDTSGYDYTGGPAPDVLWDGLYFGP